MEPSKKYAITNAFPKDYDKIMKLFYSVKTRYFGRHRKKDTLDELFFRDYASHRLMIPINTSKYIAIGYAEVSNSPCMPALTSDLWPTFVQFHYCCNLPLTPTNTCFVNRFVYHLDYAAAILTQLLSEIFYRGNKLKFIVILECPDYRAYDGKDIQHYDCLDQVTTVFYPKCYSALSCPHTQKLHVVMRDSILPVIRYRKALPEDNDDIIGIVDQDNPIVKQQLGEYYIAEELLSNNESILIVTEINNQTAGFVWLDDHVHLPHILEHYNIQYFGNLIRFNAKEKFKEKSFLVYTADRRALEKCFTADVVEDLYILEDDRTGLGNYSPRHKEQDVAHLTAKQRRIIQNRLEELSNRFKSSTYYMETRTRITSLFYNIPDDNNDVKWYDRMNCFIIQLFGLMDIYDSRRLFQILSASFAAYPYKDYCLVSVNANKQITPVLKEILKYFIPVSSRPKCYVGDHLFITHRAAIYGELSLCPARPADTTDIIDLLKTDSSDIYPIPKRANKARISTIANRVSIRLFHVSESDSYEKSVLTQYNIDVITAILNNTFQDPFSIYQCFTIRCGDSARSVDEKRIVGFVIVRPFHKFYFLQKHFHTMKNGEFHNFLQAEVIIIKLHTFFHFQSSFVFNELARQTHYYHFFYFRAIDNYYISNDLVDYMQPLEPRRIKKIWFNHLGEIPEGSPDSYLIGDPENGWKTLDLLNDKFAVFQVNLRPTTYFGSSKSIIILGFTDICKAFLRLLIFSWHHVSNGSIKCQPQLNITVICSPGVMEADHEHNFKCEICPEDAQEKCWLNFRSCGDFIRDTSERMDVRLWIRFISGRVQSIDGNKRLIKMQPDCEIYYETLLLMCGTVYGVPHRIFPDNANPPNYCHFNNRFDKILFYHKMQLLKKIGENIQRCIVVYGCHLGVFEFLNFLIHHGIKSSEIRLVMPRCESIKQMGLELNNSAEDLHVEEILKEMLKDLDIRIYEYMNLNRYSMCDDEKNIKSVTFRKPISNDEITLECDLFVSFYEVVLPGSLLNVFQAGNIETNEKYVLVNENYQTSVPNIYAIGNFIEHKTEPNHQYRFVSPHEAAEKIIHVLGFSHAVISDHKFSKPNYFQAQLPMDYFLVKVTTPKRYLINHSESERGISLVTYHDGDYSRVRLNVRGIVEEILVVTRKKKSYDFLKFFCGQHELLLNNLKSRWFFKDITSIIDFFQEPWTILLMHDDFEKLRLINKNLIFETVEKVTKMNMSHEEKRKYLFQHGREAGVTAEVEDALLEFIRYNRTDFATDIALPEDF